MIGGIIVLTLIASALTAMVVVSQRYGAYQDTSDKMVQKDIDRYSENLVALFPGLTPTSCGSCNLNQYNMSLSNNGGVAVQIARIYINTTQYTGANPAQIGCTITNKGPCLLSPSLTLSSFSFSLKDSYISSGEFNHTVRLWLPQTIALPKIAYTPSNSIWLVTSRGRVFSFQWPYPPAGQGTAGKGTPLNIVTGSMQIAYNGTSNSQTDSCHKEAPFPIASGSSGQKLYLLNPWITTNVLNQVLGGTTLYITVYTANTLSTPITFTWGQIVIDTATAPANQKRAFIGGDYVGIVLKGKFYAYGISVPIQPGDDFYLVFKVINTDLGSETGSGDAFTGTAVMNNAFSNQNEGSGYLAFTIYLDGLYVRNNGGTGC